MIFEPITQEQMDEQRRRGTSINDIGPTLKRKQLRAVLNDMQSGDLHLIDQQELGEILERIAELSGALSNGRRG